MKHLGLALLTLAGAAFAGPYDSWSNYRDITVNTASGGANVAAPVNNFPLLVRLTNASAATGANVLTGSLTANGADVRFTDSTGSTPLSFQVERWSASAAEFWVKVPVVRGNSSTKIRMYWGKAGQTAASSGASVFDADNGFRAVWHLNGTANESDATANGIAMTAVGSPASVAGAIGGARGFDSAAATRQYFTAPNTAGNAAVNIGSNSPLTLSAWVYAKGFSAATNGYGNSILNKGDRQYCLQTYANPATNKRWEMTVFSPNNGWREIIDDKVVPDTGSWVHVTGTWSGGANSTNATGRFYVNGVKHRDTALAIGTPAQVQTYDLFLGVNPQGSGSGATPPSTISTQPRPWHGFMDEVAIHGVERDSNWVRLAYETQKPGASAVALGTAQAFVPAAITKLAYVDSAKAADTLILASAAPVSVYPLVVGGPVDSFKVVGTAANQILPPGLSLNKLTGAIEGTPQGAFAAANRTIRAWGHFAAGDSLTRTVRITVTLGPLVLQKYSNENATYTVGLPVTNSPMLNAGRPATKFSISAALPAGLKIDTLTGVISGTPTAAAAAAAFTIRAMNATDTSARTIQIAVVANSETYSTWTNHRTIYLNTGVGFVGPKISANVVNFPVAVRIPANDTLFRQVLAGAADLRFTKADDATALPYEIEQWDSAKAATIWVLVDTIKSNNATQNIRMHWGKSGSVSRSSGSSVFSVANGFAAVWHMNAGAGNEIDATANGFVAAAQAAPGDTTGTVGKARKFNGTNQFFQVQNSVVGPLDFTLEQNYTLSVWANPSAISTGGDGHKLIEKGDDQWTLAIYNASTPKYWEITTKINNGQATWMQTTSQAAGVPADSGVNKWNHIVGIYRGAPVNSPVAESLWVNGAFMATRAETPTNLTTSRTTTRPVNIGAMTTAYLASNGVVTRYFQGLLDEVRVSSVVRSADWITLEYANQKSSPNFATFNPPTGLQGKYASARAAGLGLNVKSSANGVMFRIVGAAPTDKAVLSLVDMWGRTVFSSAFDQNGQLAWTGASNNGRDVSAGIYIARVTVVDGQNKLRKVLEHKVPFTR